MVLDGEAGHPTSPGRADSVVRKLARHPINC
jgi:hypothetical protein